MSNEDRKRLRRIVDELARERNKAYRRKVQAAWRRRNGMAEKPQTANRFPPETERDFALHALPYWPNVPKMVQAISAAPKQMLPAIKREIVAMARAA